MADDTATITLTDFLLARIAEDEAMAGVAFSWDEEGPDDLEAWRAWDKDHDRRHDLSNQQPHSKECGWRMLEMSERCGCNYPARVLAECEAKRRIVEEHDARYFADLTGLHCDCTDGAPCWLIAVLALPYADHDGYREEWRP